MNQDSASLAPQWVHTSTSHFTSWKLQFLYPPNRDIANIQAYKKIVFLFWVLPIKSSIETNSPLRGSPRAASCPQVHCSQAVIILGSSCLVICPSLLSSWPVRTVGYSLSDLNYFQVVQISRMEMILLIQIKFSFDH
uniref:Uncharacterized protein n=1 Tax=Pipistrellus kuhlii TaxID=59472 RepID=A0A7J7VBJ1_PIPKU|nr:hypothetical protein mPipKuh1_008485 [Pipistrellus kuhlii]